MDDARLAQASTLDDRDAEANLAFLSGRRPGKSSRLSWLRLDARGPRGAMARERRRRQCRAIRRPPAATGGALRATIVFYRAMYLADDVAPIVALADALSERGFAVEAIYVASLKDRESEDFVAQALDACAPDVILNATAFSARRDKGSVLDRADAPVLQVALATSTREAWEASARGRQRRRSRDECRAARGRRTHLHPRDLLQGRSAGVAARPSSMTCATRRKLRASLTSPISL